MKNFFLILFYILFSKLIFVSLGLAHQHQPDIKMEVLNLTQEDKKLKIQVSFENISQTEDELTNIKTSESCIIDIIRQTKDIEAIKKFNLHKIAIPRKFKINMEPNFYILIEDFPKSKFDLNFQFLKHADIKFQISTNPKLVMEQIK